MSLLSVRGLKKSFGGLRAVDEVDFDLFRGELLAMIGPNGSGKSTTFNLLNGQLRSDSGSMLLDGEELAGKKPNRIWRMGVSRTFQIAEVFSSLTVAENVQMALISNDRRLFSMVGRARAHRRDAAMSLLSKVGMATHADRLCNTLAYGDAKRVELAIALASAPKLLLMDEPTAGMAPEERHDLMGLTRQLAVDRGVAVLFTEHSMDVVFSYADRILVLARGQVVAQGTPAAVRDDPKVREVYFGRRSGFGETRAERA